MPFVLVPRLAPTHPSALAEILARATKMPVIEIHEASGVDFTHYKFNGNLLRCVLAA